MDVTFVLTHDCNLGCTYCYAGRKFRKPMTRAVRDRALALAFSDSSSNGVPVRLCYFGGEPTLEWELLVETATLARARALEVGVELEQTVTCNGTLLSKARVAELASLGVYIALSIDGTREAHDCERPHMSGKSSFDDVYAGLGHALGQGIPFETISVVTPSNSHLLGDSVRFLFAEGVPRVSINMAYEAAWTDATLEQVKSGLVEAAKDVAAHFRNGRIVSFSLFDAKIALRTGKKSTCPIGEGSVAVAPSGNLYPCERLVGEDEDNTYVIGNVDTGIAASAMRTHRDALPARDDAHHSVNQECGDCGERARCSAFCACANLAETGSIAIAGGVQCMFERSVMEIADALFETMVRERNATFAEWFALDLVALPHWEPKPTANVARPKQLPVVR
jgi:uncharacterized protein